MTAILGSMAGVLRVIGTGVHRGVYPISVQLTLSSSFSHQISELLPSMPREYLQPLLNHPLDAPRWVRLCMALSEECAHPELGVRATPGVTETFTPRKRWRLCPKACGISTAAAVASSSSALTSPHLHSTGVIGLRCGQKT